MKHLPILLFGLCLCLPVFPQEETANKADTFLFTTVKEIPITPVKNQFNSGTCWSFSGIGLIEAELLRMGKGAFDLSEMFVVHHNYSEKAQKYVRMHGTVNFAGGGAFADVLDCIGDYGIVPEQAMPGLNYDDTLHRHGELDRLLKAYVDVIIKNPNGKLSDAWYQGFKGILDAYLGQRPETFTHNGKTYTPQSFAQFLEIRPEDYISITSFTHHPFYTSFVIEIPDNWRWSKSYNLPLNEMMQVIDHAINTGYTVAWASDVSEKGFSRKGFAVVLDENAGELFGLDQAHWLELTKKEKDEYFKKLSAPVPEKKITQEMRQESFNNYETCDDHGMLIYGKAQDQNGGNYYIVKNSWGTANPYKGIWYASTPFVEYKTISIVLHKDALPKAVKNKLGLK
ncbi:MAG: aminopeptidase [Dysgonamonadaceae bacterium]|jgi:aminopeptidase C|nr:aminopeptidase [Dysgonamonadaceae bacterium]